MSIYHHFSVLPYLKADNKFMLENHKDIFNSQDAENVVVALQKQANNFMTRDKAKLLEKALNKAIASQSENYSKMIDKIAHELNNTNYEQLLKLGVIQRYRGTVKINTAKANQYSNEIREIASHLSGYSDSDTMDKVIQRLSGQLNKLRGDIFENFLAVTLDNIGAALDSVVDNAEELVIEEIVKTFQHYGGKTNTKVIKKNKTSYSSQSSRVMGDSLKPSIVLSIDQNKMSISGSQGKTDVAIQGLDGNFTGISAKNYQGGSRHISLLGSANISGLISEWPGITDERKNLAINGLSAISIYPSQFQLMKQLFLIQGLMGTTNEDIKSQLFIVNRNTAKNPILVFSVYDLLFNQNLQGNFITNINPIQDLPRDNNEFFNFIKSATLSIKTQLKISELAKLN